MARGAIVRDYLTRYLPVITPHENVGISASHSRVTRAITMTRTMHALRACAMPRSLRPLPVSHLRCPRHVTVSSPHSISDLLGHTVGGPTPALTPSSNCARQMITIMSIVTSVVTVSLVAAHISGPVHSESHIPQDTVSATLPDIPQCSTAAPHAYHSLHLRHRAAHIADFVQTIKDAAQVGPI